MYKIGELKPINRTNIVIYYDDKADVNPYRVYEEYYSRNKYGCLTKRKRQVARYGDFHSCLAYIMAVMRWYNEEHR